MKSIKVLPINTNCIPIRQHPNDAGLDLKASIPDRMSVSQFSTAKIPVGIAIEIPEGYVGFVLPRSGMSSKGITAETGTIDAGYIGEISVNLTNNTDAPYLVQPYDRIAQLVIQKVETPDIEIVNTLTSSERGFNGFGSTGK
jgi:dUTP pyrophosphatase